MNCKKIIPILGVITLLPSMALAAFNTVTTGDSTVSFVLPGNGLSYNIDSGTQVESYTVNTSNIDFTVLAGSYVKLTSSDASEFTVSGDTTCSAVTKTCSGGTSTVTISCSSDGSSHVITVTPSGTCTPTVSGGGGGGGGSFSSGGGGGGSSTPVTTAPVTTAPVTTSTPTNTSTVSNPATPTTNLPPASINRPPRILTTVQGNGTVTQNNSPVTTQVIPSTVKYIVPRQLARGASGKDVIQLQLKLQTLGFFPGKVVTNGVFGPTTFEAVKKFQSANGIKPVNGRVGPLTLATLNKK